MKNSFIYNSLSFVCFQWQPEEGLHVAVQAGNEAIIAHGASPTTSAVDTWTTTLEIAVINDHAGVLSTLLSTTAAESIYDH